MLLGNALTPGSRYCPRTGPLCRKCYTGLVRARTAAEDHLQQRRGSDPEYAAAYEMASRRVAMFDEVVSSLNARREELGITKAELARRADMPPAVVRRLFSQQHKNPTLTSLVAIADALDVALHLAPAETSPLRSGAADRCLRDPANVTPTPDRSSATRQHTA